MKPLRHAFRIRFHLDPSRRFEAETNPHTFASGSTIKGLNNEDMAKSAQLALRLDGFATATEAEENGARWADAIAIAGLRMGIGFDIGRFAKRTGQLTALGRAVMAQNHNAIIRDDVHGLDVFPLHRDKETKFADVRGEAQVTSPIERLAAVITACVPAAPLSSKLRLALDLLGVAAFEPAPRIRFLTLISAFEVVSQRGPAPAGALALIEGWEKAIETSTDEDVGVLRDRLQELKRDSIGVACRRLVREHLGAAAVAAFKKCYAARSTLVHDGEVPGYDFGAAADRAKSMLSSILETLVLAHVPATAPNILTLARPAKKKTAKKK